MTQIRVQFKLRVKFDCPFNLTFHRCTSESCLMTRNPFPEQVTNMKMKRMMCTSVESVKNWWNNLILLPTNKNTGKRGQGGLSHHCGSNGYLFWFENWICFRPGAPSSVASSQLFTRHSPSPEPDDSQSPPPPRSPNRKSPRKKKTTTTFTAGTSVAARQEKAKKKYNKNKEKSQVNGRFPKVHGAWPLVLLAGDNYW